MVKMQAVNAIEQKRRWVMLTRPGWNVPTVGSLILILAHVLVVATGGVTSEAEGLRDLYLEWGLSWPGIQSGRFGQILTHSFLHGDWSHVLVNAALFFYTSARIGHVLRPSRVVILFAACSLISGLAHLLSQALIPGLGNDLLVGASGGVMGMFLAVTVIHPDSKMMLLPVSGRNIGKGFLIASALLFLMDPRLEIPLFGIVGEWVISAVGKEIFAIGHLVHFSGGLVGILLVGRLLPRLVTLEELREERAAKEGSLTVDAV
ncbi:MAG: rhomboid family intramembrane serine protease [Verrucomicrobiaceae bacterium]